MLHLNDQIMMLRTLFLASLKHRTLQECLPKLSQRQEHFVPLHSRVARTCILRLSLASNLPGCSSGQVLCHCIREENYNADVTHRIPEPSTPTVHGRVCLSIPTWYGRPHPSLTWVWHQPYLASCWDPQQRLMSYLSKRKQFETQSTH